jgi:hypothetical protein
MVAQAGSVTVYRASLSLGPLAIDNSGNFYVDDDGIMETAGLYDQDVVSSPFVEGNVVTHDIRGMITHTMRIGVRGADHGAVQANIGAVLAAFTQRSFVLDLIVASTTYSWSCRRKGYGMRFDRKMVYARAAVIPVTFERYPTALAGPF